MLIIQRTIMSNNNQMDQKKDTHTTDYSAILTTESMDWTLERIWKDLQKSQIDEEDPKWIRFWKYLDDWARDNINQDTLPSPEWNRMQVAAWARKVLNFSEKSAKILIDQEIDGAALLVTNVENLASYKLPGGPANKLWAEIEKLKKSLAEPASQSMDVPMATLAQKIDAMTLKLTEVAKEIQTRNSRHGQSFWLLSTSTFSVVYYNSLPFSSTNHQVVMKDINNTIPTISNPFTIAAIPFEKETEFVSHLAQKIMSNVDTKRQKIYLHVTQNKNFSDISRKPDMVLTSNPTTPTSASEIVVWIELKIHDDDHQAKGQLISGLVQLAKETQTRRTVFYGAIINKSHVKLMQFTWQENRDPEIIWTENTIWGSPSTEYDEALRMLLRLINTPAESLGYYQMPYPSELIVPKVHSPAFISNSLVLYALQIHRSALKRPDIVKVCIERSDIHSTKDKKRPTGEMSHEILEGVMKVGDSHCKHEILRERDVLTRLNPKTSNSKEYCAARKTMPFIPELLGFGSLNNNDDHQYNVIMPFGRQLAEITSMAEFDRVLEDINRALRKAHKAQIFHADVSVKNIILTDTAAVLIDWGFSFIADQSKMTRGFTGTPLFASIRVTKLLKSSEAGIEYCACDDFEALFYVLLYCTSGKKLPWSKSQTPEDLIAGKQLAMIDDWKATLSYASKEYHEKLEQLHQILFPENSYIEDLAVETLLNDLS